MQPAETRAYILERLVGDTAEPDRITAAARKFAQRAIGALAEGINQLLSNPIEVELEAIELGRYGQALSSTSEKNAVAVVQAAISPDALLLDLEPDCVSMLVAACLGADPEFRPIAIDRPLTPIELDVATAVFQEVATTFNGSGSRSLQLRMPVSRAFSGPEIRKHVLRDGPSARLVFTLKASNATGRLAVTMPQRVLLNARDEGKIGNEPVSETNDANVWTERLGEEVRKSSVTLEAAVPLAQMSLGELSMLTVGQILELPAGAQASTRLSSRNTTLFVCEFGKIGQNYSVRIKHPFDESQDFVDRLLSQ